MLCLIINIVFSTNIPEQRLQSLQPEVELYEVQSKRKPFDMTFKNIYSISYNGDVQAVTHLTFALDHVFDLSINARAGLAESLCLTPDSFLKFILLSLIALCKSGCIQSVNVLLSHVRDYVNEDDWVCAHLCQIKTHLESMRNNAVSLSQAEVESERHSRLGSIYLDVMLKQRGQGVTITTRDQLFKELPSDLKSYVKEDMKFVELLYPKRITAVIRGQIQSMQKEGKNIKEISETVGFSVQTVTKYLAPEESFSDIFSSLLPKKWVGWPARAADEIGLLADQSQPKTVADSQQRDPKTKKE